MANRSETSMLRQVASINDQIRTVGARLEALQTRRRDLYVRARSSEPPVPYLKLAAAAATTEAAVMQVVNKGFDAAVGEVVTERLGELEHAQMRKLTRALIKRHPRLPEAIEAARTLPLKELRQLAA